jgi:hypothetical protein
MSAPEDMRASRLLNDLANLAQAMLQPIPPYGMGDGLARLRLEVTAAAQRPCEGERLVDDAAVMLAQTLTLIARDRDDERWRIIARALLPIVRDDIVRALAAERRVATTDQDYVRR